MVTMEAGGIFRHIHGVAPLRVGLRRVVVGCAVSLLVACSESVGPPVQLSGIYDLVSIDGRPLPTTVDGTPCSHHYVAGSIEFSDEDPQRFVYTLDWEWTQCSPLGAGVQTTAMEGTYVAHRRSIALDFFGSFYSLLSTDGVLEPDQSRFVVDMQDFLSLGEPSARVGTYVFVRR